MKQGRIKKAYEKAIYKLDKITNKIRKSRFFNPLYERREKLLPIITYTDAGLTSLLLFLTIRNKTAGIASLYTYAFAKDFIRAFQFLVNENKSKVAKYSIFYFTANILSFGIYSLLPESYVPLFLLLKEKKKEENKKNA